MCGITGKLNFNGRPGRVEEVQAMAVTLHHRGPDHIGAYAEGPVCLGMARLAVIDLNTGDQPISNEDGTVWVVCNGEIYNFRELRDALQAQGHRFTTRSDTEVIVHLYEEYGAGLGVHLHGMFAIAIWDQKRQQLVLIRDRLGVKPLYYYHGKDRLVFGSEMKALLADDIPRTIKVQSVDDYLTFGYVPGPGSIFEDVGKVPPAHSLVCRMDGTLTATRYWDHLDPALDSRYAGINDPREYRELFWDMFKQAVKARLVSDVPLGVLLSGGVDSTAVVAAMHEVTDQPIKTFTVGFDDESYNEAPLARLTADHFHTQHHELTMHPDSEKVVQEYTEHFDEPYGESSAIPIFYVAEMAKQHVTVALGGDAGDELLGGYNTYAGYRWMSLYHRLPDFLGRGLIPWVVDRLPVSHSKASIDYLARRFVSAVDFNPAEAHLKWLEVVASEHKAQLYGPLLRDQRERLAPYRFFAKPFEKSANLEMINRLMYLDSQVYLPEGILTKVDRMTMAHSLEVRGPFLDHRLHEFCARMPAHLKMRGRQRKVLLKEILRGKVPPQILSKKKMGFILPLPQWFCRELKDLLCDTLSASRVSDAGFFNPEHIQLLLNQHLAKTHNHTTTLWGLLAFMLWYDKYGKQAATLPGRTRPLTSSKRACTDH